MKSSMSVVAVAVVTVLAIGCSSTSVPQIDLTDSRRVLGRDNDVRVDAQLTASGSGSSTILYLVYEIENLRDKPIALVADTRETSYDPATRTFTVAIGSEIPHDQAIQLTRISSGERKAFSTSVVLRRTISASDLTRYQPRLVRVKVNFLGDVRPFEALDSAPKTLSVSNELFPTWLENNQTVLTNAVPLEVSQMRGGPPQADASHRAHSAF